MYASSTLWCLLTCRTFLVARLHGFFSSDARRGGVVVAEDDFDDATSLFALSAGVRFTGVQ